MRVLIIKLVTIPTFCLIALVFGLLPSAFTQNDPKKRDFFLSLGNCFAGGVFLAVGFTDLLTESVFEFQHILKTDLPIGLALAPVGFFLIFFLEKVIFLGSEIPHGHSHSHHHGNHFENNNNNEISENLNQVIGPINSKNSSSKFLNSTKSLNATTVNEDLSPLIKKVNNNNEEEETFLRGRRRSIRLINTLSDLNRKRKEDLGHIHGNLHLVAVKMLPFLLVFILSFHGLMAGLVLGLQEHISYFIQILFAILSHQWIEAFALGVSMIRNEISTTKLIKSIILYSFSVPLGEILGIFIVHFLNGKAEIWVSAILTAIAAGTFVYVAVVDILMVEFQDEKSQGKWWRFMAVLLGFALLTGVKFVVDSGVIKV